MNKYLYILAWIAIISAIVMIVVSTYWLVYPFKTTTFKDDVFPVKNKVVESGGYVVFSVDLCRGTKVQPTISRAFVDGIVYQIPEVSGSVVLEKCGSVDVYVHVPEALPPGKYSINTIYRWQVNPLRVIEQSKNTEKFEVVK